MYIITSLPSKSNVYIDDKFYGATPIQVKIDGQKSVKLVVKSNWYSDYQEEILFDSREQYNIFVKMKPDLYSEVSQEHGNTGFTFYMPTSFIETLNFFKLFKVGTGFNYMVNYPTNGIVRFYFSTDFIFAGSQKDINPEMPQGMANAFFYLNDYSFGISFRAPLWRFPIIGGVAGKFAYYVVSYNIYNFIIGGFGLGLGAELHLGFQLYVNEYVGFYFYYKIGLVPDLFYALINHLFSNIDGHYISFGIRF